MKVNTKEGQYRVSAIVSTYNSERFIRGCLDDLLSQSIADRLEIIVVDSGSLQNERSIVKEYQALNNNILYIRSERESIYSAWNRGIKAASGRYITNANTDDRHRRDALERMADTLDERPDIALVYADSAITNIENETFEDAGTIASFLWPDHDPRLLFKVCYIGPQPMWRRELHILYGYFDERYRSAGDYEFWLRLSAKERFYHIREVLGLYYLSPRGVENRDLTLSYEEAERARETYWDRSHGRRPKPEGNFMEPVQPDKGDRYNDEQKWKKGPLVSVIIPTFKRPDMLMEAVTSVLDQTFRSFEIIVVNDGGDDMENIIESLNTENNITYIRHKRNRGISAARNTGLKAARGKYIAYLDDDDIYYPKHLEMLIGCLEESGADVAYSDSYQLVREMVAGKYVTIERRVTYSHEFDRDSLLVSNYIPTLNLVHKRDCLEAAGLFDEGLGVHEDWDFIIRLSREYDFIHLKQVTAEFRTMIRSADSLSSDRTKILETMKQVHFRYAALASGENIIELQKEAQRDIERELMADSVRPEDLFLPIKSSNGVVTSMVSVIIPVHNGGESLRQLLAKIRSQKKIEKVEIVIVDSESDDDSVRIAGDFGARVVSIPRNEFNHGSTRNLGASHAGGEYLIFTVQDALPASDYWLYKMVTPFIAYPELAALSAKQFVRPEAGLFNLWENQMISLHNKDCMWTFPEKLREVGWKYLGPSMKDVLMHFDDVSSCFRRETFNDVRFRPLDFGEDMDIAKQLVSRGKYIGYMASTGVYHWHERDGAYLLQRYYIGARNDFYIKENRLPCLFTYHNLTFNSLAAQISGAYDLICTAIDGLPDPGSESVSAVRTFLDRLEDNMKFPLSGIDQPMKKNGIHNDYELEQLIRRISSGCTFMSEDKYNFRKNILIPNFMDYFSQFAEYLCSNHLSLKGREGEFVSCIFKIFSKTAGIALGAFYLEAEALNNLTRELKRLDRLLGQGVSFFPEETGEIRQTV